MPKRALVFDFFGVICSEIAPLWLAKHLPAPEAISTKETLVAAADLGEINEHELFAALSRLTSVPAPQIEREWLSAAHIDLEMTKLAAQCRGDYRIGLLTNAPAQFVRSIISGNGLDALFPLTIVSSELGFAKPNVKTYEAILDRLGVSPNNALMIDDNPANVDGAIAAGMQGVLFTSKNQLIEDIARFGPT